MEKIYIVSIILRIILTFDVKYKKIPIPLTFQRRCNPPTKFFKLSKQDGGPALDQGNQPLNRPFFLSKQEVSSIVKKSFIFM